MLAGAMIAEATISCIGNTERTVCGFDLVCVVSTMMAHHHAAPSNGAGRKLAGDGQTQDLPQQGPNAKPFNGTGRKLARDRFLQDLLAQVPWCSATRMRRPNGSDILAQASSAFQQRRAKPDRKHRCCPHAAFAGAMAEATRSCIGNNEHNMCGFDLVCVLSTSCSTV